METQNRDVFPTDATIGLFPLVSALVVNPTVDEAFSAYETRANSAKAVYHLLGSVAIWFIAIATIYTVAESLILPHDLDLGRIGVVAAALAGTGVALQLYLIVSRKKEKWLLNRFAAERTRAIKFQAYALVLECSDSTSLGQKVERFSTAAVARLENELNAGISAVRAFDPIDSLRMDGAEAGTNAQLQQQAAAAYRELRHGYQTAFANAELDRIKDHERVAHSSSDMIYLIGSILVFLALASKVYGANFGALSAWIDFLAVSAFIISLSKEIVSATQLREESSGRFLTYLRELDNAEKRNGASFFAFVTDTELAALRELDEFCRAAGRISYRI